MKRILTALSLALSAAILTGGSALACSTVPANSPIQSSCVQAPNQLIHLSHVPAKIELKVGETVAFAADGPAPGSHGSKPSVTLDVPGSLKELNPYVFGTATRYQRGDEEGLWNAYQATQPGTYTATVTYSAKPGEVAKTKPLTIVVK